MAAKLEGGAYLSSFVDAVLEKLSPILEDDDFVLEGSDSALELLGRLERSLFDVGSVLDDAELKQFSDKKVKKWLVDLQDALYKADDLLDELATRAATATQRSSCKIGEGGIALAEAVHGSAPDIAGKNSANPTALLLSGVSILCHLNLHDKVDQIQNAILDTIAEGKYRTADLGGKAKTTEFTNAIIDHL